MTRYFIYFTLAATIALIVSCSGPSAQPAPSATATAPASATATTPALATPTTAPVLPTATTQPTPAPTVSATQPPSGQAQKLNLDEYMPPGKARDLLLQSCTGCHSFVPIITGQRTVTRWESIRLAHRDTSIGLGDSDYNAIFDYLAANFNSTKPEPKLPDWFLQQIVGTGE